LIEGKIAYIVPGKVGLYDYQVSTIMSIPILSGDPYTINELVNKSGCKEIFKKAGLPTPVYAANIKLKDNFYSELTRLISNNMFVPGWVFKINNEFGGRGHAWI
jgi:hypothetical protein